jgi:rubrerythrin
MEYYRAVSNAAADAEVRRLAADFADEETGHVAALDDWLARTPRPSATWDADPDLLHTSG